MRKAEEREKLATGFFSKIESLRSRLSSASLHEVGRPTPSPRRERRRTRGRRPRREWPTPSPRRERRRVQGGRPSAGSAEADVKHEAPRPSTGGRRRTRGGRPSREWPTPSPRRERRQVQGGRPSAGSAEADVEHEAPRPSGEAEAGAVECSYGRWPRAEGSSHLPLVNSSSCLPRTMAFLTGRKRKRCGPPPFLFPSCSSHPLEREPWLGVSVKVLAVIESRSSSLGTFTKSSLHALRSPSSLPPPCCPQHTTLTSIRPKTLVGEGRTSVEAVKRSQEPGFSCTARGFRSHEQEAQIMAELGQELLVAEENFLRGPTLFRTWSPLSLFSLGSQASIGRGCSPFC